MRRHIQVSTICRGILVAIVGIKLLMPLSRAAEDVILYNKRLIEQEHRYGEALANLQKAAAKNQRSAALQYWLSIAYFRNDRFSEAAEAMEKAFSLKLYKTYHLTAFEFLGASYNRTSNYGGALNAFDRALALDPRHLGVRFGRAVALQNMQRLDEALADYNQVLAQTPRAVGALEGRAWVCLRMRNYDQAVADFSTAIEEGNAQGSAVWDSYRGRGMVYTEKGDHGAAVADFSRSLETIRGQPPVFAALTLNLRGWSFYALGEFQKALADFQRALDSVGSDENRVAADMIRGKAFAQLGLGDSGTAIRLIEEVRQARAGDKGYDAEFDLAMIHYAAGSLDKSREHLGPRGYIGVEPDYARSGAGIGAFVSGVRPGCSAARAGIVPGDVIVRLRGVAVTDARSLVEAAAGLKPGDTVEAVVLRNANETKLTLIVDSLEARLAGEKLLAPILAARAAAGAFSAQGEAPRSATPPDSILRTVPAAPATPPVATTPAPRKALVMIDAIAVIPEKVTAGELFEVRIDLFAETPRRDQKSVVVTFLYAISQNGRIIKRFDPETFDALNGEATVLHKKTRASTVAGDYELEIELQLEGQRDQRSTALTIQP